MEYKQENNKINITEFRFLSQMVDSCIETFFAGEAPDNCFIKIKKLSENYQNQLSQESISELLKQVENLFLIYLNLLDEYNTLIEQQNQLDDSFDNYICKKYINLRNTIIAATENMFSEYYLNLEKDVIRQLQNIGNKYNLYENKESHLKR